jgi:hypothetical protein
MVGLKANEIYKTIRPDIMSGRIVFLKFRFCDANDSYFSTLHMF